MVQYCAFYLQSTHKFSRSDSKDVKKIAANSEDQIQHEKNRKIRELYCPKYKFLFSFQLPVYFQFNVEQVTTKVSREKNV